MLFQVRKSNLIRHAFAGSARGGAISLAIKDELCVHDFRKKATVNIDVCTSGWLHFDDSADLSACYLLIDMAALEDKTV